MSVDVKGPAPGSYQIALTQWMISIGRFRLLIHLDPLRDPKDLKSSINLITKGDVTTEPIVVNGISGAKHGGYGAPRTWIDWWFKKGDLMICLCLQSASFPFTEPTEEEVTEHRAILESLKYCRDFPSELPPLPS